MLCSRRHEISRLEGFSDAAFPFALTLLVVSLSVPRSYAELMRLISRVPSFACCFALLVPAQSGIRRAELEAPHRARAAPASINARSRLLIIVMMVLPPDDCD